MAAGEVLINSQPYPLKGPIRRITLPTYSPAIRTTGNKLRTDDPNLNFWIHRGKLGLGNIIIDPENPKHFHRVIDATVDTSRDSGWRLALLNRASTNPTGDNALLRGFAEFRSSLWGLFDRRNGTTNNDVTVSAYLGVTTSWDGTHNVVFDGTTVANVALDIVVDNNYLIALFAVSQDHRTRRSLDGITWSAPTTELTAGLLADSVTGGEDIDAGKLVNVPGTGTLAFLWNEDNFTVNVLKSTNQGDTWTVDKANAAHASTGVKGRALFLDVRGDPAPCIGLPDGVYAYDVSAATLELLVAMPLNPDNCRAMAVINNTLYVSLGSGDIWAIRIQDGVAIVQSVGINRYGGLPQARQGWGTVAIGIEGLLYIAYGGNAASRNASIYKFDPFEGEWYHVHQHATANREIEVLAYSGRSDGTFRLHFPVRTATEVTDHQYLDNPVPDPAQGGTFNYMASGYIDFSEFDFGDPHKDKCVLRGRLRGTGLSADNTGQYITWAYGTNGDAGSTTSVGDFLSGTRSQSLGTSGRGVSALSLRNRLTFNRAATTTNTPVAIEFEITAEVLDAIKERFEIPLNLMEGENTQQSLETRIANLLTAQESITLVPLKFGEETEKQVRITNIVGLDEIRAILGESMMDTAPRAELETVVICEERT